MLDRSYVLLYICTIDAVRYRWKRPRRDIAQRVWLGFDFLHRSQRRVRLKREKKPDLFTIINRIASNIDIVILPSGVRPLRSFRFIVVRLESSVFEKPTGQRTVHC